MANKPTPKRKKKPTPASAGATPALAEATPASAEAILVSAATPSTPAGTTPTSAGATPVPAGAAPEQKLGDTPVAPWEMPTPEEKAEAKPVRQALKKALKAVDSPEKAEQVMAVLEAETAGETTEQVEKTAARPATLTDAVQQVTEVAKTAPPAEAAPAVLAEAARAITKTNGHEREALAEAVQEVLNPEQQGAPTAQASQRELLRQAVLHRLKPLDALDANLFLKINHLPHAHFLNGMFYCLTFIFGGGVAWFVLMGVTSLLDRRKGGDVIRTAAAPLAIATAVVEYPIKAYFRRRRPFISMIQAIVIGKKPGNWSFPSGHSASAFGGAWLMSEHFPKLAPLWYGLASLVAFSRIYLGDHYPGDVATGSVLGILFSSILRKLLGGQKK